MAEPGLGQTPVSLNQIEHAARKAARGSGLPWGLAEETGKATRWLQSAGLDGAAALLDLIRVLDAEKLGPVDALAEESGQYIASGALGTLLGSALVADSISASDFSTLCGGNKLAIRFERPSLLTVGFAGIAYMDANQPHVIRSDHDFIAEVTPNCVGYGGALWPGNRNGVALLTLSRGTTPLPAGLTTLKPVAGATLVARADLVALGQYAARTYVPATEASRLAGAGAGLSDND